jgi:hypothetical protein
MSFGIAELCLLIGLLCVMVVMSSKLLKKIMDTLNLFSKISQRDVAKYSSHFDQLKRSFESGCGTAEILQREMSITKEEGLNVSNRRNSYKPSEARIKNNLTVYFKIGLLILAILVVLAVRLAVCGTVMVKSRDLQNRF